MHTPTPYPSSRYQYEGVMAKPILVKNQSVFESESYAVSPSNLMSGSPVPPASTSITVSPANLSAPLLAISPSSGVDSSPSSGLLVPQAVPH